MRLSKSIMMASILIGLSSAVFAADGDNAGKNNGSGATQNGDKSNAPDSGRSSGNNKTDLNGGGNMGTDATTGTSSSYSGDATSDGPIDSAH